MNNKGLLSLWLAFLLFFNSYRLIFPLIFVFWPGLSLIPWIVFLVLLLCYLDSSAIFAISIFTSSTGTLSIQAFLMHDKLCLSHAFFN